jgi:hypothetical protein
MPLSQTDGSAVAAPADTEYSKAEAEVNASNSTLTGVGPRWKVGRTRGKGSIVIKYQQFDESQPETLPTSIQQFMEITGKKEENALVGYLIAGYNDELYTAASDPLAEFVEPTWPADAQTQFRLVVRNYSRGANVPLEDAVTLIKPGFISQFGPKS